MVMTSQILGFCYSLPDTTLTIPHVCFSNTWKLEIIKHSKYIQCWYKKHSIPEGKKTISLWEWTIHTTFSKVIYKFSAILIIIPAKFLIDVCYGLSAYPLKICMLKPPPSPMWLYLEIWTFVQVIKVKKSRKSCV